MALADVQAPPAASTDGSRVHATPPFDELLAIARDAADFSPPLYLSSVFGHPWTWLPPHHRYSEFGILDPWRPLRALSFLGAVTVPSIPHAPPTFGPPLINSLFWRPSVILQRPDHAGSYTSAPDEQWFFINGVMTNDSVAQLNAAFLADLFHRPITTIQNATASLPADLLECALGKQWHRTTESVVKALPVIYDAIVSAKRRVVVVAHSQGTIIAAQVLQLLKALVQPSTPSPRHDTRDKEFAGPVFVYPDDVPLDLSDFDPLGEDQLAKLELYCFANCATTMTYWRPPSARRGPIPWIEHFGNEFDIVARLGMLAPHGAEHGVEIAGPVYRHPGAWGHLLNEHYLAAIERHQRHGRRRGAAGGRAPYELLNPTSWPNEHAPRLFAYINGGAPRDRDDAHSPAKRS